MQQESGKFYLEVSEWIRGNASTPTKLNLALVFQVNCPGCFMHALPLLNLIHKKFTATNSFQVFAVSTAFENYEENTLLHTKWLINEGKLVGETKHTLKKDIIPYQLENFPVAFDNVRPRVMEHQSLQDEASTFVKLHRHELPPKMPDSLIISQIMSFLSNRKIAASTFDMNSLSGTPSWILYDENYNIINKWFGHMEEEHVFKLISDALQTL